MESWFLFEINYLLKDVDLFLFFITMFKLQDWLNKHFNYLVLLPYGLLDCESSVGDIKDRNVSLLIMFSFVVF